MKIIALLNEKGGVGKSATSQNLAKGFANIGKRVLLIDHDPQANTTRLLNGSPSLNDIDFNQITTEEELIECFLGKESFNGLEDLYDHPGEVDQVIIQTDIENLDILPCSLKLANTDTQLRMDITKAQHNRLKEIIKRVEHRYDFVLIDCPPILNLLALNALSASDTVIIPIKVDYAALQGYSMTMQFLNGVKQGFDLTIDYKVMFTMVPRTSSGWQKKSQEIITMFNRILPNKTLQTIIRHQSSPIVDAGFKSGFVVDDNKVKVGNDYRMLVNEIEGEKQ